MQKERLVKILEDVLWERDVFERSVEEVADLLIEKGVIVSPVPIKSDLYIVHKGTPKISKAKAVGHHITYGNYDADVRNEVYCRSCGCTLRTGYDRWYTCQNCGSHDVCNSRYITCSCGTTVYLESEHNECGNCCKDYDYMGNFNRNADIIRKAKQGGEDMNSYKEMRERHQKEFNELPLGFAFDEAGFERMMKKWDLEPTDTDKILRIPCGGFIRKADEKHIDEVLERQGREMKEAIAADKDGSGFIFEMFCYELLNHEYGYVYDEAIEQTLEHLGYSEEDINSDERLKRGLGKACKYIQEELA